MSRFENYEEFFEQNVININKICGKIIISVLIVPILLTLCVKVGFFTMPLDWLLLFSLILIPYAILQNLLIRYCKNQLLNTYVTLFGLEILVAFLGSNGYVNIYISCALIPVISCLYFNPKLTGVVTVFSYFGLLVSLWFKAQGDCFNELPVVTPFAYWIAYGSGYTVEYFFVFLTSTFITKRCHLLLTEVYASNRHIKDMQNKVIISFANLVESRDSFTGEHIKRTAIYVELIARELVKKGLYTDVLTEENIQLFVNTAPLHDLGKIRVPDQILCKPSRFTPEEFERMKTHSLEGYNLIDENLTGVESDEFLEIAKIMALYHHEKWNGTGYPNNVKGTDIPLCARIMAAADVLDALLSKRQYKDAMTVEQAMDIFRESSGSHFEPCIVDAVLACEDSIREVAFAG